MSAPESCKVKDSIAVIKEHEESRPPLPITSFFFFKSTYDDFIYIYTPQKHPQTKEMVH